MRYGSKGSVYQLKERLMRFVALSITALIVASCGTKPVESGNYPPPLIPDSPSGASRPKGRPTPSSSLRVGDTLEIFVEEDESFNGIYKVREGGDIIIPKVGRIPVAGMSVSAARSAIERELESSQLTQASVIADRVGRAPEEAQPIDDSGPQGPQSRKILVYITGKVNRPGQHILTLTEGRMIGVYEAILIAGGMSRFGYAEKVHVMRADKDGNKHRIPVNVRLIEEGKATDPPVGHGDVIVVPEKVFGTGG